MSASVRPIQAGLQQQIQALQADTELGTARAFAQDIAGRWRYDTVAKQWLRFDEVAQAWRADRCDAVLHEAGEFVRGRFTQQPARMQRAAFVTAVLRLAGADPLIAFDGAGWDRRPDLLGTPGGVVDLRSGQRLGEAGDSNVSRVTAVAPAPPGEEPKRFLQLLDETFDGNEKVIEFVQAWAGYCATGEIKEHRFLWAQGAGGAGSSTLLDALAYCLGDYATAAPVEAFATVRGERHPTEVAALAGARLVMVAEFPRNRPADETRIKAWTAGDVHSARHIRGNPFTFRPMGKLWITSNSPPSFLSVDAGIRRRLVLLPFARRATAPDPDLPEKLRREAPEILRWIIEGAQVWYLEGLQPPASLNLEAEQYFEEEDVMSLFLAECCVRGPDETDTAGKLFRAWTAFCRARNEGAGTQKAFAQMLRSRGFTPERDARERRYRGLSVQPGKEVEA